MTYKNLKKYVLLANGSQINQDYEPIKESDLLAVNNNLYIVYDDLTIVDGKKLVFKNRSRIIYTCSKESTLIKKLKELFEQAEMYYDVLKECMCRINAYCEYHLKTREDLYKEHNKRLPEAESNWYKGLHHGVEQMKQEMTYQLIWRNSHIEYFGQGGTLKKQEWFDTPLGLHKDKIYW